ncbi:hypothetical protein RSOLAG1IB_03859 [Rhizoctonia solani AG-1 IB]|uniref:CUE domain-containing protein n=1 Tax=Thanatephorus cucumeris (strain AG1-IB / isolate 7/3/14) TaxID=1108050 RepID=A0A0B7FRP2_THACB|nr:hypothetical protein RSOLAG1IB_03859 [Rhizoctonia solani AG-1 IB]
MTEAAQIPNTSARPTSPQFYTPPPPPGEPPAGLATTQHNAEPTVQPLGESHITPPPQTNPFANPEPQALAINAPPTAANPFSDTAATTQPARLEEPPQHPGRPQPLGALTETPLHSEPAPILPPRPQPHPDMDSQVPPPPRASFDQSIPDHPVMRQQSINQPIQRVAMTPVQPQPIQASPQAPALDSNPETLAADPAIASLHAMFPDFDLLVLHSVLEATGGDKDQAVDSLLAMSDPDYAQSQTQNAPAATRTEPTTAVRANTPGRQPTQTELDEEFARRLMLEEEQQAYAGGWQPANNQYGHSVPYQQYQPRRSGDHQRPPNATGGGGFGEIAGGLQQQFRNFVGGTSGRTGAGAGTSTQGGSGAGYQEQFNRIADTGKKTFSTIFTKVKQKMEEFDNRNPSDTQNMNQPQQSGHWSNWQGPPAPTQQQQAPTYAQSPPPGQYPRPAQSPPATFQHGALNTNPYGIPETASTNANTGANNLPASSGRWHYQPEGPETLPSPPAPTAAPLAEEPRRSVDAARLGLLPKRPVSLMDVNANTRSTQPQPQAQSAAHAHDSDDDSLEYVDRPMPGSMARP